ncbi:MAG: hypothetical protein V1685_00650 [Parcubacteria group bacterium]
MENNDSAQYTIWTNRISALGYSVEEWNAAVREQFSPFVRRKSILTRNRDILRTELVNLARVVLHTEYVVLLKRLVRLYRRVFYQDPVSTADLLRDSLAEVTRASENWIGLFREHVSRSPAKVPHDRVHLLFEQLDAMLEGTVKPYLRLAHAFAAHDQSGTFPADLDRKDFGQLLDYLRPTLGKPGDLILTVPVLGTTINQLRNIAAHRSFKMIDRETIEVWWGRKQIKTRRLRTANLELVLAWAIRVLAVLSLASVIVYLEYMPEIDARGTPDVTLRVESWLVGLTHNLGIVGFEVVDWEERETAFRLSLRNRLDRSLTAALIHASQDLDQLAMAVDADPTRRDSVELIAVDLLDRNNQLIASAEISILDALAYTRGELSDKDRLDKTRFHFVDWEAAQRDLESLEP